MRFWDSSAIVPLAVAEPTSEYWLSLLRAEPSDLTVWWGTYVECISALERKRRDQVLTDVEVARSARRLERLSAAWNEIEPCDALRRRAIRMLRVHDLRAADAIQLAAASVLASGDPEGVEFLSGDHRLNLAAEKEGFRIPGLVP